MVTGKRSDPLRGFKFRVVFMAEGDEGQIEVGFSRVAGIRDETEISEYREGADPVTMRKLPGLTTFDNIVLERGLVPEGIGELVKWRRQVVDASKFGGRGGDGTPEGVAIRRTVVIMLLDSDGEIRKQWRAREAWPAILEYSDLDASASDVVLETMELAHEGVFLEEVGSVPAGSSSIQ